MDRLNLLVTASNREVIRAGLDKLKPTARKSRDPKTKAARHAFLRELIACHASARRLYEYATRGT